MNNDRVSPRSLTQPDQKAHTPISLKRSTVPVPLEALHVPVPRGKDAHSSLTFADICSVAAPAAATRAGQRHRARPHGRYLRRYLAPSPKNSRIPLSCAATGATRSTTNALPTRYVYSPSRPTCPHEACCTHSRRVSLLSSSIEPARIEYTRATRVCMYVHIART